MLTAVPCEGVGGAALAAGGSCCLYYSYLQTKAEHYFHFLPFFIEMKIPFGLFWLAKTDTNVVLS